MPQPNYLTQVEKSLTEAYQRAWLHVVQEQETLANDPKSAIKRTRLREVQSSIEQSMADVDDEAADWIANNFPSTYAAGAVGPEQVADMVWTQVHQNAAQNLAQDLFKDLLEATQGVRKTTKELVRAIGRSQALASVIEGGTAQQAGRAMRALLEEKGIYAVRYVDGSRHGLAEYTEMAMRTKTAVAYNTGTLNQHVDTEYWEVFDGPNCGWSFHEDGDLALGTIRPRTECEAFAISHPNCRRAFGPRPDVLTPQEMKDLPEDDARALAQQRIDELGTNAGTVGAGQVTQGQLAAQVEQDRGRAALQARKANRQAKIAARKAATAPSAVTDRLLVREAQIDASVPPPDFVTAPDFMPPVPPELVVKDGKVVSTYNLVKDVPSAIELIDAGVDPSDVEAELKRLTKNARNVERRARNKLKAAGGLGGVAEPPKVEVAGVAKELTPVEKDIARGKVEGENPLALYDYKPGQQGPGGWDRWDTRLVKDTPVGSYVPVSDMTVEGHKVSGIAARRNGITYVLEGSPGETASEMAVELEDQIKVVQGALQGVPPDLHWLQKGVAVVKARNPQDEMWAKKYNKANFRSTATGGNGTTVFWDTKPRPGVFLHEFGHNVDSQLGTGPGSWISDQKAFQSAEKVDVDAGLFHASHGFTGSIPGHEITPGFGGVTKYGQTNSHEDFAESVRLYLADRHNGYLGYTNVDGTKVSVRFADVFPQRAKELDKIFEPGLTPATETPFYKASQVSAEKLLKTQALANEGVVKDQIEALIQATGFPGGPDVWFAMIDKAEAEAKVELEATAKAKAEEEAKAIALKALKDGKLTTDSLTANQKVSVGLIKSNATKKATAEIDVWLAGGDVPSLDPGLWAETGGGMGKPSDYIKGYAEKAEQKAIANKLGIDLADIEKLAGVVPEKVVTVKDLSFGDKTGIGVKKANAYKKWLEQASTHPQRMSAEDYAKFAELGANPETFAKSKAAEVEQAEIEIRLNKLRAELGLTVQSSVGDAGLGGRMLPEFRNNENLAGGRFIRAAGTEVSPGATIQGGAAQQAKANISTALAKRANNREDWEIFRRSQPPGKVDAFDSLTEAQRQSQLYNEFSQRVSTWATTSGDSHRDAVAMQMAIKEEFQTGGDPLIVYKGGGLSGDRTDVIAYYGTKGEWYRRVARIMYDNTQDEFRAEGITRVSLYRGMNFGSARPEWGKPGVRRPELQPANSWSTRQSVSLRFGRTMFKSSIPVERIIGSARTGFGCLNEFEFVVLETDGESIVEIL